MHVGIKKISVSLNKKLIKNLKAVEEKAQLGYKKGDPDRTC